MIQTSINKPNLGTLNKNYKELSMRILLVILAALNLSTAAFSGTEATLKEIAEHAEVKNGDADVSTYKVENFKLQDAINQLNRNLPNKNGCGYRTSGRRQLSLDSLKDIDARDDAYETLQELHKKGLVRYMIARTNTDGESENCLIFRFEVFTTDGYVLSLNYDWTT